MSFEINGIIWNVIFDNPNSDSLRRSDGSPAVGVTDSSDRTVTISDMLHGRFLKKVFIHEICHCVCFSYGIRIPIEQEEFLCDFVASYGEEVIDIVSVLSDTLRKAV